MARVGWHGRFKVPSHEEHGGLANALVGQIGYLLPGHQTMEDLGGLGMGEAELIYDIPRLVGGGKLLNLGDGQSSLCLALGLEDAGFSTGEGHVWTVDCFDRLAAVRCGKARRNRGVDHRVTLIQDYTDNVAPRLKKLGAEFNFIFIDADHSYEGCKKDWLNYKDLLSQDGLIGFHDTHKPEIRRVVREVVDPNVWELCMWIYTIQIYRRKREWKT
jgi:hypothetical protein